MDTIVNRQDDVTALGRLAVLKPRLIIPRRSLGPKLPTGKAAKDMVIGEFHAGGAGLTRIVHLLQRLNPDVGDIVNVFRQLISIFDVAKHM